MLVFWIAGTPAPPAASAMGYDGTVVVRGNEPFTYAVFVTVDQVFEISGPLTARLVANYQQRSVRVRGYVTQQTAAYEPGLAVFMVEEIIDTQTQ